MKTLRTFATLINYTIVDTYLSNQLHFIFDTYLSNQLQFIFDPYLSNQLHFIFDTYPSSSLKSNERLHRKSTPIELATITEETPLPAQMDKFWACDNNKIGFQKFASNFIVYHVTKTEWCITVISGVISDNDILPARSINSQFCTDIAEVEALTLNIKASDLRIIPHIKWALATCKILNSTSR